MKQARHHANKALEKQEFANPHGMLALISMSEKNVELAFKHIDRALELGPNETDVLAMGGFDEPIVLHELRPQEESRATFALPGAMSSALPSASPISRPRRM